MSLNMGNGISPVGMSHTSLPGINSSLNALTGSRKRGISEMSGPSLFNLNGQGVANKRAKLEPHTGTPIPPTGGPLDGFRTNVMQKPYLHTPITVPQRIVNQSIPYTRIVKRGAISRQQGSPLPVFDTIAKHQFAIMHRVRGDNTAPYTLAQREALQFESEDGTSSNVDITPVTLLSPAIFNYYNLVVQRMLFEKDPAAFWNLSASDVMKDWVFDGVCISEEMLNGAESARTSGFGYSGRWMGSDGYKVCSVNLKNECHAFNVFGNSLIEGGALYAIVRKVSLPENGASFNFNFNTAAKGTTMGLVSASPSNVQIMGTASVSNRFLPYQMFMICVPDDGILPDAYRQFVDERGVLHYDAEVIYLGKVLIAPQGNDPRPLPIHPSNIVGPVQDASLGSDQPLIKLIIRTRGQHPL
jgi:hypothetical protein